VIVSDEPNGGIIQFGRQTKLYSEVGRLKFGDIGISRIGGQLLLSHDFIGADVHDEHFPPLATSDEQFQPEKAEGYRFFANGDAFDGAKGLWVKDDDPMVLGVGDVNLRRGATMLRRIDPTDVGWWEET